MKENFKRFEFYTGCNIRKSFSTIELLPSVRLVIDNQMNETWVYHDDEDKYVLYPSANKLYNHNLSNFSPIFNFSIYFYFFIKNQHLLTY